MIKQIKLYEPTKGTKRRLHAKQPVGHVMAHKTGVKTFNYIYNLTRTPLLNIKDC